MRIKCKIRAGRKAIVGGILLPLICFGTALNAAPLESEDCVRIEGEYKTLKKNPNVKHMSKGFEWVKANSSQLDLGPIKQFIELQEQLKFRCPQQVVAIPTTKKNKQEAEKARMKAENAKLQIPLPQRKSLTVSEEPALIKVKIIPVKRKPSKKKKKVKTTDNQASFFDSFFSDEAETSSIKPKTTKKAKTN